MAFQRGIIKFKSFLLPSFRQSRSLSSTTVMKLPKTVDWENEGVLTPVKNQGRDAFCAMHASIAAMESLITIKNRKNGLMDTSDPPISLSHQYLVHYFTDKYIDKGYKVRKNGLWQMAVLDFLQLEGVPLEKNYNFKVFQKKQFLGCKAKKYRIDDYRYMDNPNEYQMRLKVAEQPIIVGVDSSIWHTDRTWKDDIVHRSDPFETQTTCHSVLIVGYGTTKMDKEPYWLVRDSYGSHHGRGGYVKIHRGSNSFGIEHEAFYPIIND